MDAYQIEKNLSEVINEFKKELPKFTSSRFNKVKKGSYGGYKFQIKSIKGEIFFEEESIAANLEVEGSDDYISWCVEYLKKVALRFGYPIVSVDIHVDSYRNRTERKQAIKENLLQLGWKEEQRIIPGIYLKEYYYDFTETFSNAFFMLKRISQYLFKKSSKEPLFEVKRVLAQKGSVSSWEFDYKGYKGILSVKKENDKIYIVEETSEYKEEIHDKLSMIVIINKMLEEGLEKQSLQLLIKPSFKYLEKRLGEIGAHSPEIAEGILEALMQEREGLEIETFFSQKSFSYESYIRDEHVVLLSISSFIFVFFTKKEDSLAVFSLHETQQAFDKFAELVAFQVMYKKKHEFDNFQKVLSKKGKLNI